jgi:hypothetical protein
MPILTSLAKLLESPDSFCWSDAVSLPIGRNWRLESPAVVWDPAEHEGNDEPILAKANGLAYVLGAAAVQDVVANARSQRGDADLEDLLRALVYFIENDAFLVLT